MLNQRIQRIPPVDTINLPKEARQTFLFCFVLILYMYNYLHMYIFLLQYARLSERPTLLLLRL